MFKNTPKTFYMGGATPSDMTMINRGVFFMGGADTSTQDWKNKPASWPDIRKNLIPNSIRLLADNRYPLGFTATVTGGYTVKINGEIKGTYASGAQCSIPQTDWPKGDIDSLTAYGATEQSGTPTPDAPMDIVSNNGVLKYGKPITLDSTRYYAYLSANLTEWAYSSDSYSISIPVTVGYKYKITVPTTNPLIGAQNVIFRYAFTDSINTDWTSSTATGQTSIHAYDMVRTTPQDTPSIEVTATHPYLIIQMGASVFGYILTNNLITVTEQSIYTDGTVETITDNLSNTATAEMLLKVGDYQDTQEVIAGSVTRNIGIKVLDGTENWQMAGSSGAYRFALSTTEFFADWAKGYTSGSTPSVYCTHFAFNGYNSSGDVLLAGQFNLYLPNTSTCYIRFRSNDTSITTVELFKQYLADQYAAGTPVIIVYPLATATTETVTPQALTGTSATVTAGSIDNLQITYTQSSGGYPIDYPTGAESAHIIDIYPTTEGNNITSFQMRRVASSGTEQQGTLWAHFNIDNTINLASLFQSYQAYQNSQVISCTAKNNVIKVSSLYNSFSYCSKLEYAPVFDFNNQNNISFNSAFSYVGIEELTFKNGKTSGTATSFFTCTKLKKIKGNAVFTPSTNAFAYCYALEELPNLDFSPATNLHNFAVSCRSLKDTILDTRAGTGITKLGFFGESVNNRISGLKGLRVSNEAPFNNATPPQINVSYTGMDRNALVQLFNDLPTVSNGQIINVTGCTGTADLTDDDKAIATERGWTIAL